jgi:hypothetical protein
MPCDVFLSKIKDIYLHLNLGHDGTKAEAWQE